MLNEFAFQIKTMDKPHTYIPLIFKLGKINMFAGWIVDHHKETLKLQQSLKASNLQTLVKEEMNFNSTLSMCINARKKALESIIRDYNL